MGSSSRKKKEKQKDFQVSNPRPIIALASLSRHTETQIEGREDQGKARQFHRYKLQGEVYVYYLVFYFTLHLYIIIRCCVAHLFSCQKLRCKTLTNNSHRRQPAIPHHISSIIVYSIHTLSLPRLLLTLRHPATRRPLLPHHPTLIPTSRLTTPPPNRHPPP